MLDEVLSLSTMGLNERPQLKQLLACNSLTIARDLNPKATGFLNSTLMTSDDPKPPTNQSVP